MDNSKIRTQLYSVIENIEGYTPSDLLRELDKIVIEHCYDPKYMEYIIKLEEQQLN